MLILPSRRELVELTADAFRWFHPFGQSHSRNALEKYYSNPDTTDTKILILASGDLHNALKFISFHSFSAQTLEIHINEPRNHLVNVARSILFLKIASALNFNDNQNLGYLWNVWYDTCWSRETAAMFQKNVEELLRDGLPDRVTVDSADSLKELRLLWEIWLKYLEKNLVSPNFTSEILSKRSKVIQDMFKYKNLPFECKSTSNPQMMDTCLFMSVRDYPEALRERIVREETSYILTGNTWPTHCQDHNTCINPTLLKPDAAIQWLVDPTACPFNDYLPLPVGELNETYEEEGFVAKHCRKKLNLILASFRRKKEKVNFVFHIKNPLELCYLLPIKFDTIYCSSSLAEEVGLANLINATGRRLSEEPESTLLVDVYRRGSYHRMDASCYVKEALCIPLSVMPSLYGLRLAYPIDRIGESLPADSFSSYTCLVLKRTPALKNIKLQIQPSWTAHFKKLSEKCFAIQGNHLSDDRSLRTYTPLTFFFTLQEAAERAGRGNELLSRRDILDSCHPFFKLTARTIIQWLWITKSLHIAKCLNVNIANIEQHLSTFANVKLFSGSIPFDEIHLSEFFEKQKINRAPPLMRLILIPTDLLDMLDTKKTIYWHKLHGAHCIDNVRLDFMKLVRQGSGWIKFSFPLISDHGLAETHSVVLVDCLTGIVLATIGLVKHLQEEPFNQLNPYADGGPDPPEEIFGSFVGGHPLFVQSCIETENSYRIRIYSEYPFSKKGISWCTEAKHPCKSAHRLVLTQKHPSDTRTLSFNLPHPFFSEHIGARYLSDAEVELTLFKALDEPWPCEFAVQSKWSADHLPQWPSASPHKPKNDFTDLYIHLDRQFDAPSERLDPYPYGALDQVRHVIGGIFELVVKEGHSFMTVRCVDSDNVPAELAINTEPDWLIRIDWTVLRSPQGVPLLLISAFDHHRALELIEKDKVTTDEVENESARLFFNKIPDGMVVNSFLLCSPEASSLFRYILRLNATKIKPSKSQIDDKISTENSPWMATFLSPRYSLRAPSAAELNIATTLRSSRLKCAYCKSVSKKLMCCQNCGVSQYCSLDCQREDLYDHLLVCDYLESRYKRSDSRH